MAAPTAASVMLLLSHAGASATMESTDSRQAINWTETAGIKWCSDGRSPDWLPPSRNPLGAGYYEGCPAVPSNWSMAKGVAACEKLCTPVHQCLGFTWYPSAALGGAATRNTSVCCFRTGGVDQKPACNSDPSCTGTRCFQKFPPPPPPPPPPAANLTIAVGRRPYVMESTGHVLVRVTPSSPAMQANGGGSCSVSAVLVSSGTVLSNGTWALRLEDVTAAGFVTSFSFSLRELPASMDDSLNVTIDCPTLGWRTERFRSFQRAPAAGAPKRSVSQVDHSTRSLRVDGEPFLSVGWYYSIFDNGERNLTEFVAQQARAGVNTLLLYTFPELMLHGKAVLQSQVLDACDAVGMKVWMDVERLLPLVTGANTTEDWANFSAVINYVKDHPATLGYYLCDDCWGHDPEEQAKFYRAIRSLDPYHVTAGAGGVSVDFSDGENPGGHMRLSLDVPLIENYNEALAARTGPSAVENTARDFPMFWTPFVNCPWSESSNQLGLSEETGVYSAQRMRATAYAGLVGDARIANLVFFDYFTNTEDRLLHGVENIAEEMADLKPSLLSPVTMAQPTARVSGPSAASLRARAWSEEVLGSDTICVHLIVLNTLNIFQVVNATIIAGLSSHATAILPFEGDADRKVPVENSVLNDGIAPNAVNLYRIGCTVAAPSTENLSPNPSFETPSLLGGVAGWSGGRAGWANADGHDTRARMVLDTTRPQHGRYALRITIPSKEALVQPWAQTCAPECNAGGSGMQLVKHTTYLISLWARSQSDSGNMHLEVLTGDWVQDPVEAVAFHTVGTYVPNQTLVASTTTDSWQHIATTVAAAPQDRFLQLRFTSSSSPGMMFIDNTDIRANATPSGAQ